MSRDSLTWRYTRLSQALQQLPAFSVWHFCPLSGYISQSRCCACPDVFHTQMWCMPSCCSYPAVVHTQLWCMSRCGAPKVQPCKCRVHSVMCCVDAPFDWVDGFTHTGVKSLAQLWWAPCCTLFVRPGVAANLPWALPFLLSSFPGLRAGREPGAGAGENCLHVQSGDLLPGDSPAEGPGGGAGEEVQEGCDPGDRRRCQRRQHDQKWVVADSQRAVADWLKEVPALWGRLAAGA